MTTLTEKKKTARTIFPESSATHDSCETTTRPMTQTSNPECSTSTMDTAMNFETFRRFFIDTMKDSEGSEVFRTVMMPALKPLIAENTAHIATLVTTIKKQEEKIDGLENEIETLKQHARKKTLMISGLNSTQDQSVEQDVMKLCKDKLQINLHPIDVDSIVRLTRKNNAKQNGDILLTLTTYKKKLEIVRAKKKLKDLNEQIYINESLTQKQGELFAAARSLVKKKSLKAAWTRDGKVYVRQKEDSPPVFIAKKDELNELS